ncbi:transglycosylase domain-containing protein [uncultured Thermanaerothrix sp.]|uniref:penicillin-binding protein n=1 Tax=uncultured Thermanaerothrix sp. TaxID=1195149 RepID=UPI002625906C|nr:transglycosylase domain-containing protein [uncultured Thermanaerothrix sp.]
MRALWVQHWLKVRRRRQTAQRRRADHYTLRIGSGLTLLLSLTLALLSLVLALGYTALTADLPPIESLETLLASTAGTLTQPTRFYDRTGTHLLAALDGGVGARTFRSVDPSTAEAYSPLLVQATLALLQPDFWTSPGFALTLNPAPQTLAERLVSDLLLWREPPSLRRTLRMRLLAWQAVTRYGRAQVLAGFLNSARFGPQTYGAEAAARRYLGKPATHLDAGEVALLLAALESPALNPLDTPEGALERQQQVLERLLSAGVIDLPTYEQAHQHAPALLPRREAPPTSTDAFVHQVQGALAATFPPEVLERGGLRLLTTLDEGLQQQVRCVLGAYFQSLGAPAAEGATCEATRDLPTLPSALWPAQPEDLAGGAVVVDVTRGEMLALVEMDARGQPASSLSRRPTGSLLTPFLALAAFARGMSPASLVWDVPPASEEATLTAAHYHGPERLRLALAGDDMGALTRLLEQLGVPTVVQTVRALGVPLTLTSSDAAPFLTHGAPLTLPEVAQMYLPLATLGLGYRLPGWPEAQPLALRRVEGYDGTLWMQGESGQVRPLISAQLAYLVHHVLSDGEARRQRLGSPDWLDLGRPAAAKLGQVADGQTVWAVGYTPHYLVAVWVGYRSGAEGAPLNPRLAATLWHGLMRDLHRDTPATDWSIPPGLALVNVCDPSGLLPTADCPQVVREIFLSENQPTQYDTLYRRYSINRETGRLATAFTPPELVEERVYLVVPPEASAWAAQAGLPLPPTQYDNIPNPTANPQVHFTQPAPFAYVRGTVTLRGTASAPDFADYRVQVGEGLNPRTWVTLTPASRGPVEEGALATWDTTGLPDGLYILRLSLVHLDQRVEIALLQVTVDNTPPQVQVRLPTPNTSLLLPANGRLSLYAEASDAYGVHRLVWRVDGREVGESRTPPYILIWNATRGEHTLEVVAEDLAGNRASSGKVHFRVR